MAKSKSRPSRPAKSSGKINVVVDKDSEMGIRKIENGYIIRESGTIGKGRNKDYYSKEYYSKTNPVKSGVAAGSAGKTRFGGKR